MNTPEKQQRRGIPIEIDLTRKEFDLLALAAHHDKRDEKAEVRWLIENYALGKLRFMEEGSEARSLLRGTESEVRYPDSVAVETSRGPDKS